MNLESSSPSRKTPPALDLELDEFDFKPITSGLGFNHQQKTQEIKPSFAERPMVTREVPAPRPLSTPKKDMNVYQNDLSLFYGKTETEVVVAPDVKPEKTYRLATKPQRVVAYLLDLSLLVSVLSVMLMFMTRATGMQMLEAWELYPHEITPLVLTLFCGFYLLYFTISEKTGTTLGKTLMSIRLVNEEYKNESFMNLLMRSMITLANFATLGLFSWFDLQNKVTGSKVVRL